MCTIFREGFKQPSMCFHRICEIPSIQRQYYDSYHVHSVSAFCLSLLITMCIFNYSGSYGSVTRYDVHQRWRGSNWEAENIGVLAIPADLPLGTVLWTSSTRTRSVTCDPELNPYGEFVHFYGNPQNESIMKGVGMGIIYNGRDLGVVSPGHKIETNVWVDSGHPKRATYKFQVYLKKIGNISGRSADEIAVFQLDGEQGLNGGEGSNYRYILTGLNNIKVTHCSVSIVAPAELDFGSISPLNTGVAASRDFSVTATKNSACTANDKLGVKLVFSPVSGDLFDNDTTLGLGGSLFWFK